MERLFKLCFVLGVALFGCGTATSGQVRPMVAGDRRPEVRTLPQDPRLEALPEGTSSDLPENFVEPVEAGSCISDRGAVVATGPCPAYNGIAVSEARAARDAMFRIRYPELRQTYEADRQVWAAHRELYEAQIARDREEIVRLQPSWWDRHGFAVGVASGFVVGAAITIAITFAVNEVSQ